MLETNKRNLRPVLLMLSVLAAVAFVSASARSYFSAAAERSSGKEVSLTKERPEQLSSTETRPGRIAHASTGMAAIANPQPADEAVEVEVLTLSAHGFEPAEMRRSQGRFMLAITNRTQENDLSLELNQVTGSRVHSVRMGRGRIRSLSDLNLPPGEYILSERNHPRWICRLIISPR